MPVRETKKTEILENLEELNLGNSLPVSTLTPPGAPPADFRRGKGDPVRILDVVGSSQRSRIMTIAMSSFLKQSDAGILGLGGPIVGIIEFGNGGAFTRLEVDVPFGSASNILGPNRQPNLEDGIILSVPGSSFRVSARNDGNATPEDINSFEQNGTAFLSVSNTMQVKAWISYEPRSSIYAVRRLFPVFAAAPAAILGPVQYNIPAFARQVRFLRLPQTAPIDFIFVASQGLGQIIDSGTVPAGVSSPVFEVPSQANSVLIDSGGIAVSRVWADYYLQV